MYAKLKGTVEDIFQDFIILDVNGVGYKVEVIHKGFLVGQEIELYIHTHVRESEIRLFGLAERNQYLLFTDLIDVSGVGPKVALAILSQLSNDEILTAISSKDVNSLKVKGVGNKTAQRLVIDLSSKIDKYQWANNGTTTPSFSEEFLDQTKDALKELGFGTTEISKIIKEYSKEQNPEQLESIVKFALKYIKNK